MAEAEVLYDKGLKNLHIVEFGNGVHNKKYSIMLLDSALTSFEEIQFITGKGHGAFYQADSLWMDPVIDWLSSQG